jgi:hypothetical protein
LQHRKKILEGNRELGNIEFGIQNCQSLNISTKNKKTDLKINALMKKGCDIIFLSDTRLNSTRQSNAIFDLEKKFLTHGYSLYYNSPVSNRGVAILISKKINYELEGEIIVDEVGNYMILPVKINNCYGRRF